MDNARRGKNVSLAGAALQLVFAAVLLAVWLYTASLTAMAAAWVLAAGLVVWVMVAVLFYCRQLEQRERLELDELAARHRAGASVFEEEEGQLRPAAARRAWMERWVVPAFTVLWAGLHVAIAVLMIRHLLGGKAPAIDNAGQGIMFLALVGFLAFLFGRYAVGMASGAEAWRLLRAPGSYLLVNVLVVVVAAVSLIAAVQDYAGLDTVLAWVVPVVQLVLAVELLLNFVLDLYRPRVPGHEQRPSFDSRLLNLVAEPGRFGHSIAEAINYQFGFEVSKTWFYRLLHRAFVPLLLAGAAVLVLLSAVVVVNDGEEYVVKRWGRLDQARGTLGAGIHLKWPWPVETARRFYVAPVGEGRDGVGRVKEALLGAGEKRSAEEIKQMTVKGRELFLWTKEHGRRVELDFLVAIPPESVRERAERAQAAGTEDRPPPPVNVIKLVAAVYYIVIDPYKYGYQFVDADKLLQCAAYREMVRYCASASLTEAVPGAGGKRPQAILAWGREDAADELRRRIQQRVGESGLDLGVKIVDVGLLSTHPPPEVAPEFEEVLRAERQREERRYQAEAAANAMLARVGGSPTQALRLAQAIYRLEQLESLQSRQSGSAEFAARLAENIARTEDNIRTLTEEIRREELLGQGRGERADSRRELRHAYEQHLATLRQIEKDPAAFDFATNVAVAAAAAEDEFRQASGEPVQIVAESTAKRWETELHERAEAEVFDQRLRAHEANPQAYEVDAEQEAWEAVLPTMVKYVLGVDPDRVEFWMNLEKLDTGMGELRAAAEGAAKRE